MYIHPPDVAWTRKEGEEEEEELDKKYTSLVLHTQRIQFGMLPLYTNGTLLCITLPQDLISPGADPVPRPQTPNTAHGLRTPTAEGSIYIQQTTTTTVKITSKKDTVTPIKALRIKNTATPSPHTPVCSS